MAQVLEIKPNFDGQEKTAPQFAFNTANSAERFAIRLDSFTNSNKEAKLVPIGLTGGALREAELIFTDSKGGSVRVPINTTTPAQVTANLSTLEATDKVVYCQLQAYNKTIGKGSNKGGKNIVFNANLSTAYMLFDFRTSPV